MQLIRNVRTIFGRRVSARSLALFLGAIAMAATTVTMFARIVPSGEVVPAVETTASAASPTIAGDELDGSMSVAAESAQDAATNLTFRLNQTSCSGNSTYEFYIGNVLVATQGSGTHCTCSPPLLVQTINDPNVLALLDSACVGVSVKHVGSGTYLAWARAEITRAVSGTQTQCLLDTTNTNCTTNNLCQGFNGGGLQHTTNQFGGSPDGDADGQPDSCDADVDGDGAPNNTDNCPATANPNQADSDANGTGDACQPNVVAVPWGGVESKAHVVYSGGSLILQASASLGGNGDPVPLASGTWDPGDGSGPAAINVSNSRVLEKTHTYTGGDFQPYTATVSVTDANNQTYTDTFKVQIVPRTLDAEVNMAIDKGLWAEHKAMVRAVENGVAVGSWTNDNANASTASTVQAFQVNGHRETGDPLKNPYVNNVARGLRYLQRHIQRIGIGVQTFGNPDTNGNGYGLQLDSGGHSVVYGGGQVIDAFIASGTPNAVAVTGTEAGRTYKDIAQDMLDAYSWGQHENDNRGGWVYNWNGQDGIDSSSSGWWAIGALGGEVWNITVPAWVKNENLTKGVFNLQQWHKDNQQPGTGSHGACSYRANGGDHSPTRTAACMLMMSADGLGKGDARYASAEAYMRRNFNYGELHGNMYAMYNAAKALRLAKDANGAPSPITLLGGDLDWYNKDAFPNQPTHGENGFARWLVGAQQANGQWGSQGWVSGTTSTAWAILILAPALFEEGPSATCRVDSNTVCQAGAAGGCNTTGTDPYATVNFDASLSTAGDNPIASYAWDFKDGSTATGETASHSWTSVATFNVSLTVTDTKGHSSTAVCPVKVIDTALPPIADPGGPYSMCLDTNQKVILDGSGSVGRGSNIVSYQWDLATPVDFSAIDFSGVTPGDKTAYFASLGAGTHDIGLRVKDDSATVFTVTSFSTVTVLPKSDPSCPQNTAPEISSSNVGPIEATGPTGAAAPFNVAATDAEDGALAASCTISGDGGAAVSSGDTFPLGTTSVTCSVTDSAGESASTTFTVSVIDTTAPSISGTDVTVEATGPGGAIADYVVTATDTVSGPLTATCSQDSGTLFPIAATTAGVTAVSCTATDGAGNSASTTVTVTVVDTTAPAFSVSDLTVHSNNPAGAVVNYSFTATDAVDVSIPVTCLPAGGSTFANDATTPVACKVTDAHGNTTTHSFTVKVYNTAPVALNDSVATNEDTPITIAGPGALSNDSDADGDGITAIQLSNPANGTATLNADGSFTYAPNPNWFGTDSFTYKVNDGLADSTVATITIVVASVNDLPVCTSAAPSVSLLWPPNHKLVDVNVLGVTDPVEGTVVTISITSIFQDEPTNTVGDGNTPIDGYGVGSSTAQVRAERSGSPRVPGDGRVYHISFTGTDADLGVCKGTVKVGVPHDQGQRSTPVDGGPNFKSTGN